MEGIGVQCPQSEVNIQFRRQWGTTGAVCAEERQDLSCALDRMVWQLVPEEWQGQPGTQGPACLGLMLFLYSILFPQAASFWPQGLALALCPRVCQGTRYAKGSELGEKQTSALQVPGCPGHPSQRPRGECFAGCLCECM